MKSKATENKLNSQVRFPAFYKLKNEDLIVLFTDSHTGTVVMGDDGTLFSLGYSLGHYSDLWIDCNYTDTWIAWHGKVTIEG